MIEIDFNGERLGLKYSLTALRMIYEKLDKVKFLQSETYSTLSLIQIVYSGHIAYCLSKELMPKVTFEQVFEWVEEAVAPDEILKAVNNFNESKYIRKAVEETEEEKKSQLIGTISSEQPTEILN